MDDLTRPQHTSPFEAIRREDDQGHEYWSARELGKILGYTEFPKFKNAIAKAEEACEQSGQVVSDHFPRVRVMVTIGSGAKRELEDFFLTRYACYLVIQNADPTKPLVALGQTYFAVQTRRQEIADELAELPEDQQRLVRRQEMSVLNVQLAEAARHAGVISPRDFGVFQNHGYRGLYGGEDAAAIKARKGLSRNQDHLDWMNPHELVANAFRASLTKQKIDREEIEEKEGANKAHHQMGKLVRQTIKEAGATLPEDMETPTKSIQQLHREEQLRIERERQPSLFDLDIPE